MPWSDIKNLDSLVLDDLSRFIPCLLSPALWTQDAQEDSENSLKFTDLHTCALYLLPFPSLMTSLALCPTFRNQVRCLHFQGQPALPERGKKHLCTLGRNWAQEFGGYFNRDPGMGIAMHRAPWGLAICGKRTWFSGHEIWSTALQGTWLPGRCWAPFSLAVLKSSDKINRRMEGCYLDSSFKGVVNPREEVIASEAWGSWSHCSHSQESKSSNCLCTAHIFKKIKSGISSQGMVTPTPMSSHLNTSNQDDSPHRPISQLVLHLTKLATDINHHSRPGMETMHRQLLSPHFSSSRCWNGGSMTRVDMSFPTRCATGLEFFPKVNPLHEAHLLLSFTNRWPSQVHLWLGYGQQIQSCVEKRNILLWDLARW